MTQRQRKARKRRIRREQLLRESATATRVAMRELGEVAAAGEGQGSRREITIIRAGWGSSGHYSAELLERDGATAFPSGTHMYVDHPSHSEEAERPERSVRDLAGRIATTPRMDGDALVAEAEIFPHWAAVINGAAADIGLSIRAHGETEAGEAEGRQGQIITAITEGISVDFVTRPGAGGKIGALIESARETSLSEADCEDLYDRLLERQVPRAERIALAKKGQAIPVRDDSGEVVNGRFPMANCQDVKNAAQAIGRAGGDAQTVKALIRRVAGKLSCPAPFKTAESLRETLQSALGEQLSAAGQERWGSAETFVFVDDYDPDQGWAVFCISPQGGERKFVKVAYEQGEADVSLAAETTEVTRSTVYVPAVAESEGLRGKEGPMQEAMNVAGMKKAMTVMQQALGQMQQMMSDEKEENMGTGTSDDRLTQLEEQLRQQETKLGEITAERDKEKDRADRAEEKQLAGEARQIVREAVSSVDGLSEAARKRVEDAVLREKLPTGDDGTLDKDKLVELAAKQAAEEHKYLAEAGGVGRVSGMGANGGDGGEVEEQLAKSFEALGLSEPAAKIAAAGR